MEQTDNLLSWSFAAEKQTFSKYSQPFNNRGVNCAVLLTHGFFFFPIFFNYYSTTPSGVVESADVELLIQKAGYKLYVDFYCAEGQHS